VNNSVAVKSIVNILTVNGFDDLLEHKELGSYLTVDDNVEYDAIRILHIMYKNTDPTTEIRMYSITKAMETVNMSDFSNNVDSLLKFTEQNFKV
jgi:hypothetical protein